ncbi:MAG: 5'/3'-nucleotidase SurE [Candidatus Omnitrophota bacterium]
MNIVLTNDDSIFSEGLYAIYTELKKIGNVTVVAPDQEKSSISHSITLTCPLWEREIERNGKFFGIALSGSPADCVKYAAHFLIKKSPDLVVSGINPGSNEGCSVFYSGTVGGAREGALMGAQAVALSVNAFTKVNYSPAVRYGMKVIRYLLKNPLPKGTFFNVNVPHAPIKRIKGVLVTMQGRDPIEGNFLERVNPYGIKYLWMSGASPKKGKDMQFDTNALAGRYVTVTPLHCDQTDYKVFKELALKNVKF